MSFLKNFLIEEDGQDMVEYGLVIALLVVAVGAAYAAFSTKLTLAFQNLGTDVTTVIH